MSLFRDPLAEIPHTRSAWLNVALEEMQSTGLGKGLRAVTEGDLKSASVIGWRQFLTLRAIRKKPTVAMFRPDELVEEQFLSEAKEVLRDNIDWAHFRANNEPSGRSAVALVLHLQRQVGLQSRRHATTLDVERDTETKVSTPVQHRKHESADMFARPLSAFDYEPHGVDTPIRSQAQPLHAPGRITRSQVNKTRAGSSTTQEAEALAVSGLTRSLRTMRLDAARDRSLPATPEQRHPFGPIGSAESGSTQGALISQTPLQKAHSGPPMDEQVVNAALIIYLTALTFQVPGVTAEWTLHRQAFRVGRLLEARVDGYLQAQDKTTPLAIVEVKPYVRSSGEAKIQMQETAQMAAWIHQSKGQGSPIIKAENKRRRYVSHCSRSVSACGGDSNAD